MKKKGIGLELNTHCLYDKCKELFPHPDILKWAVDIGIENFTLGSDGHKLNEVGTGLNEALAIAKKVGIKSISTYEKGVPTKFKI
jgi:histidinol-phosphatase (PHP family)